MLLVTILFYHIPKQIEIPKIIVKTFKLFRSPFSFTLSLTKIFLKFYPSYQLTYLSLLNLRKIPKNPKKITSFPSLLFNFIGLIPSNAFGFVCHFHDCDVKLFHFSSTKSQNFPKYHSKIT